MDRAQKAGETTGEAVYEWDLATDAIRWDENLAAVVGFDDVSRFSTGLGYAEHLAAESPTSRYDAVMALTRGDSEGGEPYDAVYALRPSRRSTTPAVWVEDRGRWFAQGRERPGFARGTIRVVTQRIEAERAALDAGRNPLSGAVGRAHFIEHVARHLGGGRRPTSFAVLLIAIETGHVDAAAASEMLVAAVARLRAEMRAHEMCARLGATRFAVLLESCNAEQAEAAAQRFIGAVEAAASAPAARIGTVLAPCLARTPEALLQLAEEALAAACRPGSPAYLRHDPETQRAAQPAAQDEALAALNEGRVLLTLQPVVAARSRKPVFHEAHARIRRYDGTLLLQDTLQGTLVGSAARNGLAEMLDRRVLELAFSMLTVDRKLSLSINASLASLGDGCWIDHLRAASRLRPDAARRLTVEVAEAGVIADSKAACALFAGIKSLGVRIAIDDFGSGQSSFKTLRQLPIDLLKIDGAFARNLSGTRDARVSIRGLIDLARNLGIPTVAEWVEDEATASLLADWGVDYLQGHLFGRAILDAEHLSARGRVA